MKKYYLMAIENENIISMSNLGYYYESQKDYRKMEKYYSKIVYICSSFSIKPIAILHLGLRYSILPVAVLCSFYFSFSASPRVSCPALRPRATSVPLATEKDAGSFNNASKT